LSAVLSTAIRAHSTMPGFMPERGVCAVEEVLKQSKKSELALVIARGGSIVAWASKNELAERTAFYWAKEPKVREEVEKFRRQSFDRALGRMNRRATKAADGMFKLAKAADSEAAQLRAWRAMLSDHMAIARFSTLDRRMLELEEVVEAQKAGADPVRYDCRPSDNSGAAPG
jgi:hypothetical protein